jgi:hypothetical protein
MHTHQIPPGCSLLGRTRPRRRPSGGFKPHAGTHTTCTHDTGDPCAYYMSKYARARARCTCTAAAHTPASSAAGPATTCPPAARSTAASRCVAPPLAVAAVPLSPPREAPLLLCRCRRCRGGARLYAYHGRCRRQGTCESRTGDSDTPPPRSRCRTQWPVADARPAESSERGGTR